MGIAFFDLDKTLLARNSGSMWVRSELRLGFISRFQALRATLWLARYHLGFANLEEALLESVASLRGGLERDVVERTRRFWEKEVRHLFRPGGRQALEAHRHAGDSLVLLTSSSNYLCELVGAELGLDHWLCNRFEVDPEGRYTGRPKGPLCFGPGKAEAARAYAAQRGASLRSCAFYTDSASDIPALEVVGRPVAVNPDPRLRRVARRRGWEIVDWGEPDGAATSAASRSDAA